MLIKNAAVSAVCLGLTVFAAAPSAEDAQAARVVVEGPENRVYEYHQNLKAIMSAYLVDGDLATAGVACSLAREQTDCGTLDKDRRDAITARYIIYRDSERLTAFALSWGKLQSRAFANVSVTFDVKDMPTSPDCSTAPQPCVSAPFCPATNPRRCDKVKGAPCTSCIAP